LLRMKIMKIMKMKIETVVEGEDNEDEGVG